MKEQYLIFNSITKEVIIGVFASHQECRDWIIGTLDQSGDAWNMDRLVYVAEKFYKEEK